MIHHKLLGRVLTTMLLSAALSTAASGVDSYVSTYVARFGGGPGYQELSAEPWMLSVSDTWTSAVGAQGSGSAFTNLKTGKLGGTLVLDTEGVTGSTIYRAESDADMEDTFVFEGPGSSLRPVTFTMRTTATFELEAGSPSHQFAELRSLLTLGNSTTNERQFARYIYEFHNGSWDQYLDEGTAQVDDTGFHEDYDVLITATVMAKPGDNLFAYSGLEAYMEGRRTHSSIDFSHTATIDVSLPSGYSLRSGSGVFLSQAVPEPGSMALMGLGVAALLRRRLRR